MATQLRYMGTKRQLAPHVAEIIQSARPGPLLDVFSGMCSVGVAVGDARQVWNNDVQIFPSNVARALFTSGAQPLDVGQCETVLVDHYIHNLRALQHRFAQELGWEDFALRSHSLPLVLRQEERLDAGAQLRTELASLRTEPQRFPYRLFTLLYAGTYCGLQQCIEIDSVAYAISEAGRRGELSEDDQRWLRVALGSAVLQVASTTGHFAQFLTPKPSTLKKHVQQRGRGVWEVFLEIVSTLSPVGTPEWRAHNRVYQSDCLALLDLLARAETRPGVVYADPPYTDDQYSRYYHLWETLMLYDYPVVSGKARYRPDRFITPFSLKSRVVMAFQALIGKAADCGADLVLSYPENGLLWAADGDVYALLRERYRRIEVLNLFHEHSTLGASKGAAKGSVTEYIYWARI